MEELSTVMERWVDMLTHAKSHSYSISATDIAEWIIDHIIQYKKGKEGTKCSKQYLECSVELIFEFLHTAEIS